MKKAIINGRIITPDGIKEAVLLHLIFKLRGIDNIALITDSMRGAGMPDALCSRQAVLHGAGCHKGRCGQEYCRGSDQ